MNNLLIGPVVEKIIYFLVHIVGGGMLFRLWIQWIFRSEYKEGLKKLDKIRESYNLLCFYSRHESKSIRDSVQLLGQFCWDEIRLPLRLCTWTFTKREDRNAIRAFLKMEEDFKNQPSWLDEKDMVNDYADYVKKHIWCLNFMRNIYLYRTNNVLNYSDQIYETLPMEYGLNLDRSLSERQYFLDNNLKILSANEMTNLVKSIVDNSK